MKPVCNLQEKRISTTSMSKILTRTKAEGTKLNNLNVIGLLRLLDAILPKIYNHFNNTRHFN